MYVNAQQQLSLSTGHTDTLHSVILNEKRSLWIYTPPLDTRVFSKPGYPVMYILDGENNFLTLTAMINQLSIINGNKVFPEMIIVGIINTPGNRTRDLTPSKSPIFGDSGGGDNFTSFLEKELIPYVDKNYPAAPYRTLIGHSLGGLTVMNTLIHHTSLFNAYVAIDPSMSYDQGKLLINSKPILQEKEFLKKSLFLGAANTINPGMDTAAARQDTTQVTQHLRSILALSDQLRSVQGLRWNFKYYPDEDHTSVPLIAEYDALKFIFRHYKFPQTQPVNQFFDKKSTAAELEKLISSHYQSLSDEMDYIVRPSEQDMNRLGYIFLQQKDNSKAEMFFQLNIRYYPESFNAYDSMGDYYLSKDNKPAAVKYFEKALALKYRSDIKLKLEKLK
ncbi:alpha/beta hydrolase-fold protein [Pedobacter sp. UYP1]|uniref:alpha/beta hydrolase-fold protein n=1 Tax=Pedobacter sp. UYP1 TaxID=1756396 RepID=UPI00339A8E16